MGWATRACRGRLFLLKMGRGAVVLSVFMHAEDYNFNGETYVFSAPFLSKHNLIYKKINVARQLVLIINFA